MFVVGMIIAGIIAAFVAKDAGRRGMNAAGWFFGVFLLLIAFLPIYFVVRKPLLPQYQPQLPQPPQGALSIASTPVPSLCMHCDKYFTGQAEYCPHCGKAQVGSVS